MSTPALAPVSPSPVQLRAYPFALRNLQLLSAIETTVDALEADTGLIESIEHTYDEIYDILIASSQNLTLEAVQVYLPAVDKAGDAVSRRWCDARDQRAAALADDQLHDDRVVQAWQQFMDALYSLHEKIETVRDWLEDMKACMQPKTSSKVFTDVDEMFDHILAGS